MIPEVEGTRPWGPPRKRVPKCLKGPKTTYTTIEIAEKQSMTSKKGPFSLYIGSPWSHPGNGICGARRVRSLPSPRLLRPWRKTWEMGQILKEIKHHRYFSKTLSIIFTIQFIILFSETLIISQTKSRVSQKKTTDSIEASMSELYSTGMAPANHIEAAAS